LIGLLIECKSFAELFGMLIPVHVIGFIYALFVLKEVKPKATADEGHDNAAGPVDKEQPNRNNESTLELPVKRNLCREFFDPKLAIHCVKSFFKQRPYGVRSIIILLMLMHFVTIGITQGETSFTIFYQRTKFTWDADLNAYHNVFAIVTGLVGTIIAIGFLSKFLNVPDILLALISTGLSIVSRLAYGIARDTITFFIGTAIDFTAGIKFLGVKSIVSKVVPSDDLSTMFAIMGLFEALSGMVFPFIYPTLYVKFVTDNIDVALLFYLSAILFAAAFIVYL